MNHTLISTDHITEHRATSPGLDLLVRVYDKGMNLTITPKAGAGPSLVLKGSQIRALRKLLNVAVEEDQS